MAYEANWTDSVLEVNLQKTEAGVTRKAQVLVKGVKEEGELADMKMVAEGIAEVSAYVLGSYYCCETFELTEEE